MTATGQRAGVAGPSAGRSEAAEAMEASENHETGETHNVPRTVSGGRPGLSSDPTPGAATSKAAGDGPDGGIAGASDSVPADRDGDFGGASDGPASGKLGPGGDGTAGDGPGGDGPGGHGTGGDERGGASGQGIEADDDGPDAAHQVPDGLDEVTVEALGKLSEALETVERVRGHLYSAHQLVGTADFALDEAVSLFMQAGQTEMAERIQRELIGRNVIPGHWTFQIVEEFDDGYYAEFRDMEREARERLAGGRRHLYEAQLKERRRTRGRRGHEARPSDLG